MILTLATLLGKVVVSNFWEDTGTYMKNTLKRASKSELNRKKNGTCQKGEVLRLVLFNRAGCLLMRNVHADVPKDLKY